MSDRDRALYEHAEQLYAQQQTPPAHAPTRDPIDSAMAALPDGYYWVRMHNAAPDEWQLAELVSMSFWLCGNDVEQRPSDIEEIGEQIAPYKPHPNPPEKAGEYWVRRTRTCGWAIAGWYAGQWMFPYGPPINSVAMVGPRLEKPRGDWSEA
jgi:hypothetical protein